MREIKFRAWNKETKKMWWFNVMWGNTWNPGSGWIGMVDSPDCQRIHGKGINSGDNRVQVDIQDCELMQYTGRKDKNNVEIYEGDILDRNDNILAIVSFEDGKFGWDIRYKHLKENQRNDCFGRCYANQEGASKLVIIGNIYSDPHLLNK